MFSKILVATDFSDASNRVVQCAACLRCLGVREAVLGHALAVGPNAPGIAEIRELNATLLTGQRAALETAGIATRVELLTGPTPDAICRYAQEHGCGLLVIGSHGMDWTSTALLGGSAYGILQTTRLPTLVIRVTPTPGKPPICSQGACALLDHVLFPTDFSDNAEHALPYVRHLAECGARRVTLAHVQDRFRIEPYLSDRLDEFNRIDRDRLSRIAQSLQPALGTRSPETALVLGRPGPEIVRLTAEGNCSLVVMGTQGRGALAELLLGSVSHYVARRSPAPTLLIPKP